MFSREFYSKQAACQMCRPGLKNEKQGHWTWTCLDRSIREKNNEFPPINNQQLNYFDILTSWRSTTEMHTTGIEYTHTGQIFPCVFLMFWSHVTQLWTIPEAPGGCAWLEAHTHRGRGQSWTGVILSSDGAENSDWPAQGGGCQLSGSVPSVVSESQ